MGVMEKISFLPKVLKYDPDSQDIVLSSQDKVTQINNINQVKVFLHPLYKTFYFTEVQEMINKGEHEAVKSMFGLKSTRAYKA
jgi:hypothetical protein